MEYSSHSAVLALFKKYFLLGEVVYPQTISPESAKAFKLAMSKAFALSGRLIDCYYTQGKALG